MLVEVSVSLKGRRSPASVGVRVAIWLIPSLMVLMSCTSSKLAARASNTASTKTLASISSDEITARGLAETMIIQGRGRVDVAEYVVTNGARFEAAGRLGLGGDARKIRPSDRLLVVQIFGSFHPTHSVPVGVRPFATGAVSVFNFRTADVVLEAWLTDRSQMTASPTPSRINDAHLFRLGTPRPVPLG
jgi:hypothetical protein